MNKLITANPDKTRPVVDKVFSFDEASHAYAYLESQKHVGKVVIKVAWARDGRAKRKSAMKLGVNQKHSYLLFLSSIFICIN